jgi:hypothetical protein
MKRGVILGLALALAATAVAAVGQALYSPPEADFTVAFPGPPKVQVQPAIKSHDIGRRRYMAQEPSRYFVVAIDQYPDGQLPQLVDAGVYDHILRDHAGDNPTRLVSTKPARLAGRPCLEGTFHQPDGVVEVIRVLMIGDTLYELTFAHPEDADQVEAASAFFSSFKLTPANRPTGPG